MAFPIHPSRSDFDLMYSVLYDDFTAEAAIAAIKALDAEEPFPDPPVQNVKVRITFVADTGGSLQGQTIQLVQKGSVPAEVPTVRVSNGYEFAGWTVNGEPVDMTTYVVNSDTRFVATFVEIVKEVYLITIYDVAPRTTQTGSDGVAVHTFNVKAGDQVYDGMFGVSEGPIFNAAGEYIENFNEKPTYDTWYQRVDNSESLTVSNNYYRKTFYAGRGGHIQANNSDVYAYTSQVRTWTSITTPTPVPDNGWHFSHWVNLATGATVDNPSSGTTTSKFVAIFVED